MVFKGRLTSDDSDFRVVLMALDSDWKLNAISVAGLTNAMTVYGSSMKKILGIQLFSMWFQSN